MGAAQTPTDSERGKEDVMHVCSGVSLSHEAVTCCRLQQRGRIER